MTRRELGAGVSVMWVIFLIVLLLAAGAYIYFVQSDIQRFENEAKNARSDADEQAKLVDDERRQRQELSELLGFKTGAGGMSSPQAVKTRLDEIAARFSSDVGSGDKNAELVIERLVAVADRNEQEKRAADGQFQTEYSARQAAETAKDDIGRSLQGQLDSVNDDLRDARQRATSAQETADSRYNDLQEEYDQKDTDMRQQAATFEQQLADLTSEKDKQVSRVQSLAKKVEIIGVDDAPWAPDGKVIDASVAGDVFIDVGSKDLLRKGVRFDVYDYDKGGNRVVKGRVEVRELGNTYSVARVIEQNDALNPIAGGDVVSNPHFKRDRTKNFVLVGDFPAYGKSFLSQRLEALGASVSDKVNSDVDAIILGSKSAEEDAPELTDLPEYVMAQDLNIQVMKINELEPFLRP